MLPNLQEQILREDNSHNDRNILFQTGDRHIFRRRDRRIFCECLRNRVPFFPGHPGLHVQRNIHLRVDSESNLLGLRGGLRDVSEGLLVLDGLHYSHVLDH